MVESYRDLEITPREHIAIDVSKDLKQTRSSTNRQKRYVSGRALTSVIDACQCDVTARNTLRSTGHTIKCNSASPVSRSPSAGELILINIFGLTALPPRAERWPRWTFRMYRERFKPEQIGP